MNTARFKQRFAASFPPARIATPVWRYANTVLRRVFDPCPGVPGMSSIRKLRLLQLAFSCLEEGEGYLEVGTFQGKSLIEALAGIPPRTAFTCENLFYFDHTTTSENL